VARGTDAELEHLLEHLRQTRGFDFTGYKRASLSRRVDKRLESVGVATYPEYEDYLEVHPDEFAQLFDTILINVTGFFRDAPTWEYVRNELVPRIVAERPEPAPIRVWSAGCASGEEAYSLAMVFAEALGPEEFLRRVKVYATDADDGALNQARQATYDERQLSGVPADLQATYFESLGGKRVFRKDLRRALVFGRHDLIQDAPISRIDLLVCRNTLMYFNAETQNRMLARFHFALNDGGYLFLGKAEMLLSRARLFAPVDLKRRVFTKVGQPGAGERLLVLPTAFDEVVSTSDERSLARDLALDGSGIAHMVIDATGLVAFVSDEARRLFGMSARDVGRVFQELDIAYRPVELHSRIRQAYAERGRVEVRDVELTQPGGRSLWFDIRVNPLFDTNSALIGCSVMFVDATSSHELREELEHANRELESAYEELQSTNEELETTNEELQSTVEELETTNEELQSTNEELETMNEELQSSNEELQTINDELRDRTSELNEVSTYMESILTGLRGAVVVVDRDLHVRVWSRHAEELWGLRANEVADQHLLDLDIGLPVDGLRKPIRSVLSSGEAEVVVVDATNRRGRDVTVRVSITPLRADGSVTGAILLMEDGAA
jgi:two-component system CheB/CheR fusion protein